jgi:hypothetical protein
MLDSALRRVMSRLRPARIATPEALETFLRERASLIAQKCAIDYCRGKTGLASYALFTEKPFLDALDVCRWESFAAVLGDLLILVETALRPHVEPSARERLCDALVALYRETLSSMPVPSHRLQGWDGDVQAFASRLQAARADAPRQALDVADHSAKRMFDTLPIHSSYRELDEEVVYGAVRFRMIATNQELQRRLDGASLASAMLG